MPTATLTVRWTRGSEVVTQDVTITGDTEHNGDYAVPAATTNYEADIGFRTAGIQGIMIVSDQNITIKTNSSGAPQETLTLVALKPIFMYAGDGRSALFAGTVTKLYISNGTAAVANVTIREIEDATP